MVGQKRRLLCFFGCRLQLRELELEPELAPELEHVRRLCHAPACAALCICPAEGLWSSAAWLRGCCTASACSAPSAPIHPAPLCCVGSWSCLGPSRPSLSGRGKAPAPQGLLLPLNFVWYIKCWWSPNTPPQPALPLAGLLESHHGFLLSVPWAREGQIHASAPPRV